MTKTAPRCSAAFGNIFSGKKVLLTGHTGFKGSWLSEWLLLLGANVTGYSIACEEPSLFNQLKLEQRLTDVRGDVRDLERVTALVDALRPDFVFHLAAQPLVRLSYTDPVGTFTTNVTGSINVLEAIHHAIPRCAVVMVTTDKVYENLETGHAYRETDPLGGHDPYSASKAAAEIAIDSYRKSFFSHARSSVAVATARAGNVMGGGDWAEDRLVPDAIRSLRQNEKIPVRNKDATRPWQHVLDPLSGYLTLAAALWQSLQEKGPRRAQICSAFNFGPEPEANRTVAEVIEQVLQNWPGEWEDRSESNAPHEAGLLNLNIDKARQVLEWKPVWDFNRAVEQTVAWYREADGHGDPAALTDGQIQAYYNDAAPAKLSWALK